MQGPENLEMEPGQSYEDKAYINVSDLNVRMIKKTEKAKVIPASRSIQHRVVLILGVLQILSFITMVILIRLLFIYYKNIKEELSHLENKGNSGICYFCTAGWIQIGSKFYYFPKTPETWERSREECAKNGSLLLFLDNTAELNPLLPFMEEDRYWIGLQRETQNSSRWLWVDGTPLTFSLWNEGEPNNVAAHYSVMSKSSQDALQTGSDGQAAAKEGGSGRKFQ